MAMVAVLAFPAKAKPRMAAMASGATRQVITAERSRIRRRSSLVVMVRISRRAPALATCLHPLKLALVAVIALEPVGVVLGGRSEAVDDDWGGVEAVIRLDATRFGNDAVTGLGDFSHLVVVFQFHLVGESEVQTGSRRPRGNPDWPVVGMFAQRARMRPNRLGVSACRLVRVADLDLHVRGLDAIDGSPVLDVKPYMREFEPDEADVHQPAWASELMQGYY